MSLLRLLSTNVLLAVLSGCSLAEPGGRVGLLVVLPTVAVVAVAWWLRGRRALEGRRGNRNMPDHDER